jgi:peroxiredoxin
MESRIPPLTTSQSSILQPGTSAPDFTLNATPDQLLSLKDYLGKPFILAFYPADFSPVCGDEMTLYNEILPEFRRYKAEILGISVDGPWCHLAFSKDRNLHFPLLSDFEPKGEVASKYGAYDAKKGICERALFVIDENGIIRWSYLSPIGVNPGAEGILDALETINSSFSKREQELESRQRVAEKKKESSKR